MLHHYLVAMGIMVVLTTLWVVVQMARRRMMAGASTDEDFLGERAGCGSCSRHEPCDVVSEPDERRWRER